MDSTEPGPKPTDSGTIPKSPAAPRRTRARSMTARLRELIDQVTTLGHSGGGKRPFHFYPLYAVRVLIQVIKQWVRDRCPQQASSLAFGTALSLVPLAALCLALLRATGAFQEQSSLVDFLARQVIPVSREEISSYLLAWAGNLSFETAGIAGLITTTTLSFLMYYSIEQIFNDIWRVERRRSLSQKFVVFYAVFTIVPLLLGYSLYQATRYGLTEGPMGSLTALGSTWGAIFLANKLLPACKVRWGPAAIGALFSAVAFEGAKNLFHLYVAKVAFHSYAGVYGTLGLVPIFLVWVYYSWLVVLLGAEIAHAAQNLHQLEGRDRRQPVDSNFGGVAAARIMVAIVQRWRAGGAMPRDELVTQLRATEDVVERIVRRLRDGGLVVEVEGDTDGYLPARPPNEVTLGDVLNLFRGELGARPEGGEQRALDEALDKLDAATKDQATSVTMDALSR